MKMILIAMIVKMIQDLGKRMEVNWKEKRNGLRRARIFKEQTDVNNAKTEMKNTLEGINGRIKKKNENRPVSETSRTILNTSTFAL